MAASKSAGDVFNNQSLVPNSFRYHGDATMREIIAKCKEHGVSILASSDAHYHAQIGQYHLATALIKDANYPPELVLNTSPALFEAAIERKRREWTI
jgi:putative hydrolase